MPIITCIEDLRQRHQARVPRMFWDYCESGSYTEQTFRENAADFTQIRLRQLVARDLSDRRLGGQMLGQQVTMPLAISPTGSAGMQWADGEILGARAAKKFGVPFTLSTMSICSIEDLAEAGVGPFWFQLYVMRDEDFVDRLIARAKAAGCPALVVTLDLQVIGQRHKDIKNGLSAPPRLTLPNILNMMTRPAWCLAMARTKRRTFRNVMGHVKGVTDLASLNAWTWEQFEPRLTWDMVRRIRDQWQGKFVLKGILDADDARMALDVGADAIVVSNHGGRQQDGALSSIRMLPGIVRALTGPDGKKRAEIYIDSGIRSGQDVLKARALGADAAMIGRPWLYGLGAMGEAGVTKALEVIRDELDIAMALCGERDLARISRDHVLVPKDFEGDWA
ncbi:alpha-hydroxy-acid oxidizing protein [Xinfangfangia sp. D13-10-4-6]|uniref:alpha-hydroxy acid oxidase n=1 Tax=Pseudogemmobacter hezensis TaxID=2737662 RepID=UPI001551C46B|nr:alpha-hydroxy acid oxidase [Pseudogemmobacter hezensis]NPD15547.1 alpha-hydroxy-acid oxidizing protein [Pseudogemmobacter hezensis]